MNETKDYKSRMFRLWFELISTIVMAIGVIVFIVYVSIYTSKIEEQNKLLSEDTPVIEIIVNKEI